MSFSRNWPGIAESTGTGPTNRVTTPGVVNRKLSVPQNSTIAKALPAAESLAENGRDAIRIAVAISSVPRPRATVVTLKMSYTQLISGLCSMSTRLSILMYLPNPIHAKISARPYLLIA